MYFTEKLYYFEFKLYVVAPTRSFFRLDEEESETLADRQTLSVLEKLSNSFQKEIFSLWPMHEKVV